MSSKESLYRSPKLRWMSLLAALSMVFSPDAGPARAQSPDVPPVQPTAVDYYTEDEYFFESPTSTEEESAAQTVSSVDELRSAIHLKTNLILDPASPDYEVMLSFVQEAQETGLVMTRTSEGGIGVAEQLQGKEALGLKKFTIVVIDRDCFERVPLHGQAEKMQTAVRSGAITVANTTFVRAGSELYELVSYLQLNEQAYAKIWSDQNYFRSFENLHGEVSVSKIVETETLGPEASVLCAVTTGVDQVAALVKQVSAHSSVEELIIARPVALSLESARSIDSELVEMQSASHTQAEGELNSMVVTSAGNDGEVNDQGFADLDSFVDVAGLEQPAVPNEATFLPMSSKTLVELDGEGPYVFAALGTFVQYGENGRVRIVTGTSFSGPELARQILEILQSLTPEQWDAYNEFRRTGATANEQTAYLLRNFGGRETSTWILTSGAVHGSHELDTVWAEHLLSVFAPTETQLVSARLIVSGDQISSRDYDMLPVVDPLPEVMAPELQLPRDLQMQASLRRIHSAILDMTLEFDFVDGTTVEKNVSRGVDGLRMGEEIKAHGGTEMVTLTAEDVRHVRAKILSKDSTFTSTTQLSIITHDAIIQGSVP